MILWNRLFLVFISLLITLNNRVSIAYITIFCYTNSVTESWQSGNAPDSKSGEPIYIGAQVQILYSPFYKQYVIV